MTEKYILATQIILYLIGNLMVKDVRMVELATENIPIIENRRRRRG